MRSSPTEMRYPDPIRFSEGAGFPLPKTVIFMRDLVQARGRLWIDPLDYRVDEFSQHKPRQKECSGLQEKTVEFVEDLGDDERRKEAHGFAQVDRARAKGSEQRQHCFSFLEAIPMAAKFARLMALFNSGSRRSSTTRHRCSKVSS